MAANIKTLEDATIIMAANDVQTYAEVKTTVDLKIAETKKALLSILTPLWDEDMAAGSGLVTNYKIPTGDLVGLVEGEMELQSDGGLIQVVMKVPSVEIEGEQIQAAKDMLEGHYSKLFKEELVIDTVTDPKAFMEHASTHPKLDTLFKLGATGASFKVKDAQFFEDCEGVTLRTRTVNKTSFLSKLNDLPKETLDTARGFLTEFLEGQLSPSIQVGNRTEAATTGK